MLVILIIILAWALPPGPAVLWCAGVFTAWVVSLYLWPFGPCLKCGGTGKNRGSKPKKRYGQCRRCEGSGRRIRIGARTVHRGRVSLAERRRNRK